VISSAQTFDEKRVRRKGKANLFIAAMK